MSGRTNERSVVFDYATPRTVACQGPLCLGFSRQDYWSGLPFPVSGTVLLLAKRRKRALTFFEGYWGKFGSLRPVRTCLKTAGVGEGMTCHCTASFSLLLGDCPEQYCERRVLFSQQLVWFALWSRFTIVAAFTATNKLKGECPKILSWGCVLSFSY